MLEDGVFVFDFVEDGGREDGTFIFQNYKLDINKRYLQMLFLNLI